MTAENMKGLLLDFCSAPACLVVNTNSQRNNTNNEPNHQILNTIRDRKIVHVNQVVLKIQVPTPNSTITFSENTWRNCQNDVFVMSSM
jgi:hypothetical protein